VQPNAPALREAVDTFLAKAVESGRGTALKTKYFENGARLARYRTAHANFMRYGRISPYDPDIRRASEKNDLDWLLVAAVMYEESGFSNEAQSSMGAVGLMQIMPPTAAAMGVLDPLDPAANIRAGTKYLSMQITQFDSLNERDAVAFGLAAYNVGLGHVLDARQIAAELGLDPNKWHKNVEVAIELLAHRRFYNRTSSGYFRGSETARYVNAVLARWETYNRLMKRVGPEPAA
jgi:membrane-bound lytic murein transglycosylase F